MTSLHQLLGEHGHPIEADLRQFYGVRLTDLWRGLIAPREVLVLVEQLASEPRSRYRAAALGSTDFIGWDRLTALTADLFDALQANTVVTARVGGGKAKPPPTYPRPSVAQPTTVVRQITSDDLDDFPFATAIATTSE
jgi:hypothetical protein